MHRRLTKSFPLAWYCKKKGLRRNRTYAYLKSEKILNKSNEPEIGYEEYFTTRIVWKKKMKFKVTALTVAGVQFMNELLTPTIINLINQE